MIFGRKVYLIQGYLEAFQKLLSPRVQLQTFASVEGYSPVLMAFPTPLIGDIMMLSQLAWKIGFAITFGRAGAPAEFKEVENELKSLTTSITLLAETLNKDDSLITRLDKRTKVGLDKILGFCRQTIEDLDAFVTRYQEIRHENGVGEAVTQKSWKQLLIKNYKKFI